MDPLPTEGLRGSAEEHPGLNVHRNYGVEQEHSGQHVPAAAAGGTKVPLPLAHPSRKVAVLTSDVGEQHQNAVSNRVKIGLQ